MQVLDFELCGLLELSPGDYSAWTEILLPAQGPVTPWEQCVHGHPGPSVASPEGAALLNTGGISRLSGELQHAKKPPHKDL